MFEGRNDKPHRSDKMQRVITEDKIVTIETVVTEQDRNVDYQDLLDCVEVKPDEWGDAPWDNCDGFGHETRGISYWDHDDMIQGANNVARTRRKTLVVEFDNASERCLDGDYRWYRSKGASKQVAAELVAQQRAFRMELLIGWLVNGWEYWVVCAEFNGYEACGCGGIDDYDYASGEVRAELADELAEQLEEDGFVITGKPVKGNSCLENRAHHMKQNVHIFDWK
jgi:hypothetical protein